jgi:hypothetical protein
MSALLTRHPRLHVSITSVVSGILLASAAQCFVVAVRGPLAHGLAAVINWFIKHGHYDIMFVPQQDVWWTLSISNLVLCVISAAIGLVLAFRQFAATSTRSSSKMAV